MEYLGKPNPNAYGPAVVLQGTEPVVHREPPTLSPVARHPLAQQVGESTAAYHARIRSVPQSALNKAMGT